MTVWRNTGRNISDKAIRAQQFSDDAFLSMLKGSPVSMLVLFQFPHLCLVRVYNRCNSLVDGRLCFRVLVQFA